MRSSPHLLAISHPGGDYTIAHRRAECAIWEELTASIRQYPQPWQSLEEGAMLLAEELDELWAEVRANHHGLARAEAVQLGALGVRFAADLYDGPGPLLDRCHAALAEQRELRSVVGPEGRACASSHEAFGFLRREFDALWSAVIHFDEARSCALRLSAAAVRFIAEVPGGPRRAAVGQ